MTKFILLLSSILLFTSCNVSDDSISKELIESQWKLTSVYLSPGFGDVIFSDVDSDKVLTFRANNIITSTNAVCSGNNSSNSNQGTYDAVAGTISAEGCTANYTIENDVLQVNYQCIEQCSERYTRID